MPLSEVLGESRGVWVQLLKTAHGLAGGTREWRSCFLATPRGLGFETSVFEPCVLVLSSPQQGYHDIIGAAVDYIAGVGDEVWEEAITKVKNVSLSDTGKWERENSAVEESRRQLMDPCASGKRPASKIWT